MCAILLGKLGIKIMLTFAEKYKNNGKYSQFGEQGIIDECLRRIKPDIKKAFEFGAPTFEFCSNTAHLYDLGWSVQMFDINHPTDARIEQAEITPENVNHYINGPVSVLSIDTDGQCYPIWKAYTGRPDIVIIEVNSSIPPTVDEIPGDRGASYKSMVELGLRKGYFVVTHTGNIIFCLTKYKHLFPDITGNPVKDYQLYFNTMHL